MHDKHTNPHTSTTMHSMTVIFLLHHLRPQIIYAYILNRWKVDIIPRLLNLNMLTWNTMLLSVETPNASYHSSHTWPASSPTEPAFLSLNEGEAAKESFEIHLHGYLTWAFQLFRVNSMWKACRFIFGPGGSQGRNRRLLESCCANLKRLYCLNKIFALILLFWDSMGILLFDNKLTVKVTDFWLTQFGSGIHFSSSHKVAVTHVRCVSNSYTNN